MAIENLQFAVAIIIKPLDAPLAWVLAIFKHFGGLGAMFSDEFGFFRMPHPWG
jgi:hypothetical protein